MPHYFDPRMDHMVPFPLNYSGLPISTDSNDYFQRYSTIITFFSPNVNHAFPWSGPNNCTFSQIILIRIN